MQAKENQVVTQAQKIITQVRRVVVGKDRTLLWVLAAIMAKGHILLEDIPGVGKTTMALAFSKTLGLSYNRVQFTPDVLPSDVTGYSILNQATG
jgi:MoxR-like ATPase